MTPSSLLADARFLLPAPVRTVVLLGEARAWAAALTDQGVEVHTDGRHPGGTADLAIGPARRRGELAGLGRDLVLLGPGRGPGQRLAVLPRSGDPTVLLPVGGGATTRAAVRVWSGRTSLPTRALARAAGAVVAAGHPGRLPRLTVQPARPGPSWLVAAAAAAGLLDPGRAVLAPGRPGSRSVLAVADGSGRVAAALKFSRDPSLTLPFEAETRAHAVLAGVDAARPHTPRLRGSLVAHGHHLQVEDFAAGRTLLALLPHPSGAPHLRAVGSWLVDLAAATRSAPAALQPERERLATVTPHPAAGPAAGAALARLGTVPGVLEHGDLGPHNVMVSPHGFTALDWETLRRPGWPLWDLLFAHEEANAWVADGVGLSRADRFLRLMRGERPGSAPLFAQVRATVAALGLDPEDVGRLATLCWADRAVAVARAAEDGAAIDPAGDDSFHLARPALWAADPALGEAWACWR